MSHDIQPQANQNESSSKSGKEEEIEISQDFDQAAPSLNLQRMMKQPPNVPHTVQSTLQLQRTIGNHATAKILAGQMRADANTIQRWPEWLDKLIGPPQPKYEKLANSEPDDDAEKNEQLSRLEEIKIKLQPWADRYAIHKNYQKYAKLIGNRSWKVTMQVWEYVNKVLSAVSNLDPSGITKAIAEVSKLIKMLASYVTEAYEMVADSELIGQLQPLLSVSITDMIKSSIEEIKDIWDTGKSAWDAVADLA